MKFRIKYPMAEIREKVKITQRELKAEKPKLLKVLGVQLLSFTKLDYETKGRGGTGTDGITWKPLAESTIEQKTSRETAKPQKSKNGRIKPRKTGSGKRMPALGSVQIGVDTGLQRASASPGFIGKDGKGGNLFQLDTNVVTVGYNRSYSGYFDEERSLLPKVLPEKWKKELDDLVQEWADDVVKKYFDKGRGI